MNLTKSFVLTSRCAPRTILPRACLPRQPASMHKGASATPRSSSKTLAPWTLSAGSTNVHAISVMPSACCNAARASPPSPYSRSLSASAPTRRSSASSRRYFFDSCLIKTLPSWLCSPMLRSRKAADFSTRTSKPVNPKAEASKVSLPIIAIPDFHALPSPHLANRSPCRGRLSPPTFSRPWAFRRYSDAPSIPKRSFARRTSSS